MENLEKPTIDVEKPHMERGPKTWIVDILLISILLMGAYFRFIGIDWDGNHHLHPDERFLTMVATSITPTGSSGDYFDTSKSTLNPNNVGYGFYVYGTLPLFMVRYAADLVSQTGYDQVNIVGRALSAVMDLVTVLLVFLITRRLYKNARMALLAAAFSAAAVLQIQLSHFFAVDTFQTAFAFMAVFLAVRIMTAPPPETRKDRSPSSQAENEISGSEAQKKECEIWLKGSWVSVIPYILFGLALGMAVASKVNSALIATLLPLGAYIWYTKLPEDQKNYQAGILIRNILIAGVVALLTFRIFQPYAFSGPGFFDLMPNEKWVANMKEVANQTTGDVDFPPALQWARRPVTFAWQNMVNWGLGLPLGLLAWAGFLWMGWKVFRGEWKQHLLLWGWTGFYFAFQSVSLTSSMRYQMLVYPSLTIIAAWAVFTLWEQGRDFRQRFDSAWLGNMLKGLAWAVGAGVLIWTIAWAYAFTRIYTRPVTRVAASEWIYQNVPGPINLKLETEKGLVNQPMAFRNDAVLTQSAPIVMNFQPQIDGTLTQIVFSHIVDPNLTPGLKNLVIRISEPERADAPVSTTTFTSDFPTGDDPRGSSYPLLLSSPVSVFRGRTYRVEILPGEISTILKLAGPVTMRILDQKGGIEQPLPDPVQPIRRGADFSTQFTSNQDGLLKEVFVPHIVDWEAAPGEKTLTLSILDLNENEMVGSTAIKSSFLAAADRRGSGFTFVFNTPLAIKTNKAYSLQVRLTDGQGSIAFYGSRQALESSWDDPLPLGLNGYSPYDYNNGIYRSDLNFEMYWEDNTEKLDRFLTNLNQADYLFISSNRQWGTTIRVPERYPLTTEYYRTLIGCPEDKDIFWCYAVARPGMFESQLGYDLEAVFMSEPTLGGIEFNSQFAEEAFSVYDHPKVLIFKKRVDFKIETARQILSSVDLSQVIHVTPKKAAALNGNLMLAVDEWKRQMEGGTWSQLFSLEALQNKYPAAGAVLWYLVVLLLGLVSYPLLRIAMKGLPDRGYPFGKLVGMVILAYIVWLAGCMGVSFTRLMITAAFGILLAVSGYLGYRQRKELLTEIRDKWKYFLTVEGITLALFILFLLVRLGNPDLWHPYKGGEKPMDFSYLNAVIKSTTFPPYDPWFAGGYINYYYYGFVIVGVLIKWLGIIPSIAYNLVVPTLFALAGIGAFSLGWNLLSAGRIKNPETDEDKEQAGLFRRPLLAGLASTIGFLILGNLGTVRMIWQGFQRLAAPGGVIDDASIIEHWVWGFRGFINFVTGAHLGFPAGDWYWVPSRAFPGEPITEFPNFTFLYADLHAHMIALPITLLALSWALSILLGKWDWSENRGFKPWLAAGISLAFGALVIGTLRPTNTWDFPTYLAIGCLALIYTILRYGRFNQTDRFRLSPSAQRILAAVLLTAALAGLSFLIYQPFSRWFAQGYNAVRIWDGARTPFWSYFTHWGLFLFINISFLVWETRDWLATTPASALNKFNPYQSAIWLGLLLIPIVVIALVIYGVSIAWLVIPLLVWVVVMILRPGLPEMKRFTFFIFGCALFLSMTVELITLEGDIGRMNTVFKFYMQSWTFMAISAGAGLVWLYTALPRWSAGWRSGWGLAFALLFGSAALFPLTASIDKINDRMNPTAPHTLDGMKYMETSVFQDIGGSLDLNQDYKAIQWMQDNVSGSPVIVEGNTVEYRWGSRFTIYTGLPGVVGWNWHQRQQRGVVSADQVTNRVNAVGEFYMTTERNETIEFLNRYNVEYIIVGQLEKLYYQGFGLQKFPSWNGDLWEVVYNDHDTAIYKVKR
jgi:YYY domain-containing protein